MDIITHHTTEILAALLAVSEVLALIPQVRANGLFHAAQLLLQGLQGKRSS
jgi:hypothetical protein